MPFIEKGKIIKAGLRFLDFILGVDDFFDDIIEPLSQATLIFILCKYLHLLNHFDLLLLCAAESLMYILLKVIFIFIFLDFSYSYTQINKL